MLSQSQDLTWPSRARTQAARPGLSMGSPLDSLQNHQAERKTSANLLYYWPANYTLKQKQIHKHNLDLAEQQKPLLEKRTILSVVTCLASFALPLLLLSLPPSLESPPPCRETGQLSSTPGLDHREWTRARPQKVWKRNHEDLDQWHCSGSDGCLCVYMCFVLPRVKVIQMESRL